MATSRTFPSLPSLLPASLLAFLLAPLARAQMPSTPLPPANPSPLVYCPPERLAAGPASPYHVLNVFLPPGPAPAEGFPVVVATGYGGGASVPAASSLNATGASAPLWNLVAAGIAVVHFGTPGIGGGRGLWYPPGHPSGRYESFRPADDNPEKSAEWALQWVKVQTLFPFDLARVGLRGSSGGAVLAIRTAMGPERARASGSAQLRASTRVAAILAIQPPTSAWALEQGPELTIPFPRHFEQAASPGVVASQLTQVEPELQRDYSLMRVAFQSDAARANNAHQALCLVYGDPVLRVGGQVATFALDASGFPVLYDLIKQPTQHDSWFGYAFWKRLLELGPEAAAFHGANSVFAMRDIHALAPPLALHTRTYAGTALGVRATRIGHDWLVARLNPTHSARLDAPTRWAVDASRPPQRLRDAELVALAEDTDGGVVLPLALRGERGTLALLAMVTEPGRPVDFTRPALAVRLAPDEEGWSEFELELAAPQPGESERRLQALLVRPGRPGAASVRLSNVLRLRAD